MKKLVNILLMVLVIFFCNVAMADTDKDLKVVSQGINKFSFDLYKKLKDKNKEENLFYSPASISIALAMTYAGARGNTEKQMANVLNFTLPQDRLHPAYSKLIENLKSNKDYELNIANALWLQKDYKYLQEFLNTMEKYYKGGFNEADYITNPEGARIKINDWVSRETKEKIKDILNPKDITSLTRLVLTNAIYFKGKWQTEFNKMATRDEDFYLINGQKTKVKMMYQKNTFNYYENDDLQLLEISYKGNKISMVIILPKVGKFKTVENMMDEKKLQEWLKNATETKVEAYIPRFKFTQRFDLSKNLSDMGMKDAFDEVEADFSGINGEKNDLYISKVIHKAFVEVNEEGTEAAAATAVVLDTKALIEEPVFKADHPFIFLIRDKETGSILFMGRVMDPNKE
ncbi:MAG TPA: serpin family protein [Sulfurihydrogenibium sp.]|uniref:serpin family protein n=1 Tax=Sulfurihydrogenibium sp. (strain YO3AOP1) TaxID=436114 RepID=UPI0001750BF4|nr:serpin family protein [Sulfurihydrogenibium sp. YO3AOP1]ACD67019.1 proteinase inhibitor I4 serpin [Sulfurihydrogenibium sp. YO3AOP1]HBT98751.1 serpin family protein [Sulfurihydrogenibium sp.]